LIRHEDIDDGRIWSKPHKVCCCHSLCFPCNFLFYPCRKAVSGSKRRYEKNGFSIDLTYLSPRIIVHGFPSTGIEHMYRNPRYEVKRFLDTNHPGHFKVYNFCCEPGRGYNPEIFDGRVERYPFKDHNTPPLETMVAFGNSVKAWMEADPANVVSMHCKAGKGRAGLMSCVALIRTGVAKNALDALDLYDRERVSNNRGLTVTSQRKWVIFYEALWRQCWGVKGNIGDVPAEPLDSNKYPIPVQPTVNLLGVELFNHEPSYPLKNIRIQVYKVTNFLPKLLFDSEKGAGEVLDIECDCFIEGNFKVFVSVLTGAFSGYKKVFELLHNTFFMNCDAKHVDFNVDQLDIKRKIKAKIGPLVVRLKFTRKEGREKKGTSRASVQVETSSVYSKRGSFFEVGSGSGAGAGMPNPSKDSSSPVKYAMVTTMEDGDGSVEVEMSAIVMT
jgi:hypothetical protein